MNNSPAFNPDIWRDLVRYRDLMTTPSHGADNEDQEEVINIVLNLEHFRIPLN